MEGWQITPSIQLLNFNWMLLWIFFLLEEFCHSKFRVWKRDRIQQSLTLQKGGMSKMTKDCLSIQRQRRRNDVLSRRLICSLPCHTLLPSTGCSLGFGFIQKGHKNQPIFLLIWQPKSRDGSAQMQGSSLSPGHHSYLLSAGGWWWASCYSESAASTCILHCQHLLTGWENLPASLLGFLLLYLMQTQEKKKVL